MATGDPAAGARRVVLDAYGPPEVLAPRDTDVPQVSAGEVLVRVAAAGVNVVDLYQRSGVYPVSLPFTPGIEGSGTVLRVGADVDGVAVGDRVAWMGQPGAYATHCLVPATRLVPVPDGMSLTDAAAVLIHGMTAHLLTTDVYPLADGAVCVVHSAAGGVGGLLCQLAARRGATVIGTVSQDDKIPAALAAGAHHVVNYRTTSFPGRVRELTGGRGADVVYDAVGRDTFADGLTCLRPGGTMVLYGQASGAVEPVDPQLLNSYGSLFLTKASLSHYDRTPELTRRRAAAVFDDVLAGRLRVRVHAVLPLTAAAAAHEELASRRTLGKILLVP
ncbi:quinone oxidoreductase family protein [Micromonospora eburnea]|uniref:NADPH2:quinone reductase n=1 Tax=Micromonospora eburnea TaxID=227316 RepID=A0A1C6UTG3_9ACTN|nr:quinone oxidoreductase [Micromonospora eburnea]SCL57365.1 NADPH2:quinone reductase [Micromonospora eburnea]